MAPLGKTHNNFGQSGIGQPVSGLQRGQPGLGSLILFTPHQTLMRHLKRIDLKRACNGSECVQPFLVGIKAHGGVLDCALHPRFFECFFSGCRMRRPVRLEPALWQNPPTGPAARDDEDKRSVNTHHKWQRRALFNVMDGWLEKAGDDCIPVKWQIEWLVWHERGGCRN